MGLPVPFPRSFQRSKPRQIFTMSVFESYWANKAACDDAERAYYEKLSGCKPVEAEAPGAVKQGRVLLGATNPKDSAPGTIRGDLCIDVGRNIIHGSDCVEAAEKEIALWFSKAEITSWRSAQTEWVYEEEELEPLQTLPAKVDGLVSASGSSEDMALVKKLNALEVENKQLKKVTDDLKALVLSLEARVGQLEGGKPAAKPAP